MHNNNSVFLHVNTAVFNVCQSLQIVKILSDIDEKVKLPFNKGADNLEH